MYKHVKKKSQPHFDKRKKTMPGKIFFIDGHALIFKMYYAFLRSPMINSKGADMSILYGFTKYILELQNRENPDYLAVAFDPPGGTFRNKLYPEYKANRKVGDRLVGSADGIMQGHEHSDLDAERLRG